MDQRRHAARVSGMSDDENMFPDEADKGDVCYCGTYVADHSAWGDHSPVPMGALADDTDSIGKRPPGTTFTAQLKMSGARRRWMLLESDGLLFPRVVSSDGKHWSLSRIAPDTIEDVSEPKESRG